jgi:hypothetical protein
MTATSAKTTKPVAPPSVPPLTADLDAGLRRLKLAAIRRTAPEVLLTAKTNAGRVLLSDHQRVLLFGH